jgi:antitoxin component YwqK of YwqJK toxin-antitoxin module
MKYVSLVFSIVLFNLVAQVDDWLDNVEEFDWNVENPISEYERFNIFTINDSVRLCDKKPCKGWIKDYYPNGQLKHKGYYENGKLPQGYENYFDNGQLERKFTVISPVRAEVMIYYKDGTPRTQMELKKNQILKAVEYYPTGKVESIEEYSNNLKYYIKFNFYYSNGNPQSILEIVDPKKLIYTSKKYYKDGQLKEEGFRRYDPTTGDYKRIGEWKFYNLQGKLIKTINYNEDNPDE